MGTASHTVTDAATAPSSSTPAAVVVANSGLLASKSDASLQDHLTDAESVTTETATATRDTSPESIVPQTSAGAAIPDQSGPIAASGSIDLPATSVSNQAATQEAGISTAPTAVLPTDLPAETANSLESMSPGPGSSAPSTPTIASRRLPSSRGASLQAAQSITMAYIDPTGSQQRSRDSPQPRLNDAAAAPGGSAKRQRALQHDDARARRSASIGSNGTGTPAPSVSANAAPAAGSSTAVKKTSTSRTAAAALQIELPPGMLMVEGDVRVIPGIEGALVPAPNAVQPTDTNMNARMEPAGSFNNDLCEVCGTSGRFICCDGCPRSFHFHCMNPPLDIDEMPPSNGAAVLGPSKGSGASKGKGKATGSSAAGQLNPEELWFCNVCVTERRPNAHTKPKGFGPFGQLLPVLARHNPETFKLPQEIQTYFKDVGADRHGDYVDSGMLRPTKPNKPIEPRDPYRLKDKNGAAVLCFRCGGTALPPSTESGHPDTDNHLNANAASLCDVSARISGGRADPSTSSVARVSGLADRRETNWRPIISCDFCSLHWHVDCVDPPMLGMPSNLRRWMCPAHSDHVNARLRVPRIGPSVPKSVDLPVPSSSNIGPGRHFRTRVVNNGDIDIIPDPLELLMGGDGRTGSLQEGVGDDACLPRSGKKVSQQAGSIRYRYPERVITTDFWTKVGGDQSSKIASIFYVAVEEAGLLPTRLITRSGNARLDSSVSSHANGRYRPFGERDYPRSGLDALADIAHSRLVAKEVTQGVVVDLVRPSRTRQLVATALGIELTNEDVPESNVRDSLSDDDAVDHVQNTDLDDSPLSSVDESETDEPDKAKSGAQDGTETQSLDVTTSALPSVAAAALSEEEQIKQIAMQAASGVSDGEPLRLAKRKAAVVAESALVSSPAPASNKKARGDLTSAANGVAPSPSGKAPGRRDRSGRSSISAAAAEETATLTASRRNGNLATSNGKKASINGERTELEETLGIAQQMREQSEAQRKEIEQLRAIAKLIELKGFDRTMEFVLTSNEELDRMRSGASTALSTTHQLPHSSTDVAMARAESTPATLTTAQDANSHAAMQID
ncbi:hypothetical protein BCV70DRAFT_200037, partial [Testicularia cyperi]